MSGVVIPAGGASIAAVEGWLDRAAAAHVDAVHVEFDPASVPVPEGAVDPAVAPEDRSGPARNAWPWLSRYGHVRGVRLVPVVPAAFFGGAGAGGPNSGDASTGEASTDEAGDGEAADAAERRVAAAAEVTAAVARLRGWFPFGDRVHVLAHEPGSAAVGEGLAATGWQTVWALRPPVQEPPAHWITPVVGLLEPLPAGSTDGTASRPVDAGGEGGEGEGVPAAAPVERALRVPLAGWAPDHDAYGAAVYPMPVGAAVVPLLHHWWPDPVAALRVGNGTEGVGPFLPEAGGPRVGGLLWCPAPTPEGVAPRVLDQMVAVFAQRMAMPLVTLPWPEVERRLR